jgi:molybdenum cofactor cytidylyltransferase
MSGALAVHAVVLAAGRGRRMGGPKHLLPVGEPAQPMLARVLASLRASGVSGISAVLRPGDAAGEACARAHGAQGVFAEDADEGRAASVRAGVRAVPGAAHGLLFALADQPFLMSSDFAALLEAFAADPQAIVHARYDGVRGTPVLFARRFWPELLALRGRDGGRLVIAAHAEAVRGVELPAARGRDIDRPEDLFPS